MPKRAYLSYVAAVAASPPAPALTPVRWMESSRADLKRLSEQVQHRTGFALQKLQRGEFPRDAALLKGDLSGLIEIRVDDPGGTYRTVLTVKLAGTIYVLHVFQKKSTHGIGMPRRTVALIKRRLASARALHDETSRGPTQERE